MKKRIVVGLAGNPNSGKTTFFNNLTGSKQKVGNWAGVTVEKKIGIKQYKGYTIEFVDLPGIYSLTTYSIEEIVARNFIVDEKPDVIVDIIDSTNIERSLFLTAQLLEMGVHTIVALNMFDEAQKRNIKININKLSELLCLPVIPSVARENKGTEEILEKIISIYLQQAKEISHVHIHYGDVIEEEIKKLNKMLNSIKGMEQILFKCPDEHHNISHWEKRYPDRWLSVKLLSGDSEIIKSLKKDGLYTQELNSYLIKRRKFLASLYHEAVDVTVSSAIYGFINGILMEVVDYRFSTRDRLTDNIDSIVTNKVLGLPLFFLILAVMFLFTFKLGQPFADRIDLFFNWLGNLIGSFIKNGYLKDLLVDGIIAGVGNVIVFLPNIVILFFFISFLEDSGYMARAAFIMDRIMHKVGLHGKSFISLILGLGCNVPAVMSTRTLENRRDRIISILVNPLISCQARLPVYILFTAAFFPKMGWFVILMLYLIGGFFALLMAKIFGKTLFKGMSAPFAMELPPYRFPTFKSMLLHMWEKSITFVKKAGTVILAGVIIVWFLGAFPVKKEKDWKVNYNEQLYKTEKHFSSRVNSIVENSGLTLREKKIIMNHLEELLLTKNDKIQIKIILYGLSLKKTETILKKIYPIYGEYKENKNKIKTRKKIEELEYSYAGRLGKALSYVMKPLGFNWQMSFSLIPGFIAKEIVVGTFAVFYNKEDERLSSELPKDPDFNPLKALVFMVFTLLYIPCLSTVAVIKRETNSWKWAFFSMGYSFVLAYIVSFIIYKIGGIFW